MFTFHIEGQAEIHIRVQTHVDGNDRSRYSGQLAHGQGSGTWRWLQIRRGGSWRRTQGYDHVQIDVHGSSRAYSDAFMGRFNSNSRFPAAVRLTGELDLMSTLGLTVRLMVMFTRHSDRLRRRADLGSCPHSRQGPEFPSAFTPTKSTPIGRLDHETYAHN
jgi:hypothetical protein